MRNLLTLLVLCLTTTLTTLTAQIQQFISSNDFPFVETYEADVCLGSPVTLSIVDSETTELDWTWYGPGGFFAEGKSVYISSIAEHQLGLFEAVSTQGDFYHFELSEQNDDFVNFKNGKMLVAGKQVKIKSPIIRDGYTYQWSNGAYGPEINVSLIQNATYTVTVTTPFGCSDSDEISIYVAETQEQLKTRTLKVCKYGNYYLDGPKNFMTYEWLNIDADTEDIIIEPAPYIWAYLKATKDDGKVYYYRYRLMKIDCEASNGKETAAVDPVLSNELNRMEDEILEQANSNKLDDEASVNIEEKRNLEMIDNTIKYADIPTSIYPNPATDFITVDIDDQASLQNVKITVLDNGQNRIFEGQAKSRSQKIDLRNFKSGIYYLVVRSDKGRTTQQFIVAR